MLQPPAPPQVPAPAATPSSGGQEGCWVLRLFLQEKTPLGRKGSPKWGWGQPRQHQAISKPPQSSSVEPPTLLWHQGGPGQLLPSAVTSVLGWGRDGDPGDAALGWGPLVGAVSPLAPVVQGGSWGSEAAGWCEAATERSQETIVWKGLGRGREQEVKPRGCPAPAPAPWAPVTLPSSAGGQLEGTWSLFWGLGADVQAGLWSPSCPSCWTLAVPGGNSPPPRGAAAQEQRGFCPKPPTTAPLHAQGLV